MPPSLFIVKKISGRQRLRDDRVWVLDCPMYGFIQRHPKTKADIDRILLLARHRSSVLFDQSALLNSIKNTHTQTRLVQ